MTKEISFGNNNEPMGKDEPMGNRDNIINEIEISFAFRDYEGIKKGIEGLKSFGGFYPSMALIDNIVEKNRNTLKYAIKKAGFTMVDSFYPYNRLKTKIGKVKIIKDNELAEIKTIGTIYMSRGSRKIERLMPIGIYNKYVKRMKGISDRANLYFKEKKEKLAMKEKEKDDKRINKKIAKMKEQKENKIRIQCPKCKRNLTFSLPKNDGKNELFIHEIITARINDMKDCWDCRDKTDRKWKEEEMVGFIQEMAPKGGMISFEAEAFCNAFRKDRKEMSPNYIKEVIKKVVPMDVKAVVRENKILVGL